MGVHHCIPHLLARLFELPSCSFLGLARAWQCKTEGKITRRFQSGSSELREDGRKIVMRGQIYWSLGEVAGCEFDAPYLLLVALLKREVVREVDWNGRE